MDSALWQLAALDWLIWISVASLVAAIVLLILFAVLLRARWAGWLWSQLGHYLAWRKGR
jgi:hypothetical protein